MPDIFISYARSTTAAHAQAMAVGLRALGYDVWFDEALPAHRVFEDVLKEHLIAAKAVVVIWSNEAVKSQWVRSEANRAREAGKLVQLAIDDAPLPMPFDQVHCADMQGWTGDLNSPGWRKVVASIGDLTGGPRAAASMRIESPSSAHDRTVTVLRDSKRRTRLLRSAALLLVIAGLGFGSWLTIRHVHDESIARAQRATTLDETRSLIKRDDYGAAFTRLRPLAIAEGTRPDTEIGAL
jgi:TIR domain